MGGATPSICHMLLAKGNCKANHVFRDEGGILFLQRCRKYLGTKAQVAAGREPCVGVWQTLQSAVWVRPRATTEVDQEPDLSITDILGWIILCPGRAVLCIVGYLTAFVDCAHEVLVAPPTTSCDNEKCL